MRILHINTNYITTALHQKMIMGLKEIGVECKTFSAVCQNDLDEMVIQPDKDLVISKCFYKMDRVLFDFKQLKIRHSLEKKISGLSNYDIIHAYTLFTDGYCAMKLSQKYGIPYVVAIRDTDVNAFFRYMVHLRSLGLRIMKNASAIFFLSDSYKVQVFDKYVPQYNKAELLKKTYIIPNGIDQYWIDNRPVLKKEDYNRTKTLNIIFAGKINERKNPLITAKAVKRLNESGINTVFTIVGKIEDNSLYNKLIKYDFVKYYPQQSKEKLMDLYRASDIFVMPSITETFGLVYAEAMSQGIPVVYSKQQGFDGQFKEGDVGYHVDPRSVEEITNAIKKILLNYNAMSERCISLVNKFEWSNISKEYHSIYSAILKDNNYEVLNNSTSI